MSHTRRTPAKPRPEADFKNTLQSLIRAGGEPAWLEVLRKMDDVYTHLLLYQTALEDKNDELEKTQQFVLSVLTSMSDVLIVCDLDGKVEEVNRALVELTGFEEAWLRGKPVGELFVDRLPPCTPQRRQGAATRKLQEFEAQLHCHAGGAIPVELNCTARFDAHGEVVGNVMVGRPVGELRRAYQALRDAHEELKRTQQQLLHSEKMVSLGRLVAGVAHELNNPISFVVGNAHALKRYSERIKTYLGAVHDGASREKLDELRKQLRIDRILEDLDPLIEGTVEGAERTRAIVEGLKRFSAKDSGENAPFNLCEAVTKAVGWVTGAAGGKLQVDYALPENLTIVGSAGQIQQVAINLVQNAFDATRGQPFPELRVAAAVVGGWVDVSFHDNGPGIPPEHLERLFDPFFTTKPVGKGTGLGLSISYGIVARHGGELSAANHLDGGAVFTLRLPLERGK
ncbi:MAG: PAS domain-containing protein [Sulfuricella sp.]|nr:PAS domain-containing protein [Sulfuricella sp.]